MNRFVPAVLLAFSLLPLSASPGRAEMAFGVKAGVSVSQVNADLFDTDNRTGFVGGVYGVFGLGAAIALQPEVLFVRKGAKLFSTDVSIGGVDLGDVGSTLDVDYVEIPVLLRLSLVPAPGPADVRLLAGPVASFKVNESVRTTGLLGFRLGSDQVKTTDWGLAAGAALALRTGTFHLVGEGRYTFGLTDVSDLPFGGDIKNGAWYATLGLEFPFGTIY